MDAQSSLATVAGLAGLIHGWLARPPTHRFRRTAGRRAKR